MPVADRATRYHQDPVSPNRLVVAARSKTGNTRKPRKPGRENRGHRAFRSHSLSARSNKQSTVALFHSRRGCRHRTRSVWYDTQWGQISGEESRPSGKEADR